ncbi:hypothetical protein ACEN2I_17610 [Flavobacterium sp. W22_SRS_FK3]|uniref:hypothetical protein n=1 Tax=Flavobacterium sp. W22_SRS_FK3 TaxID=3240275 RepID=UPI003F8FE61B
MAIPNPKDFIYIVAKDIQEILFSLRNLEADYSDIVKVLETQQLYYFHDISHNDFYFHVGIPDKKSKGAPTLFPTYFKPDRLDSESTFSGEANKNQIVEYFYEWISIVADYNSISFNEEEIFSDFVIIDDDAETKPFDNHQQIILYTFLETTVNLLEEKHPNNNNVEEIIQEANSLKNEIPLLTKRIAFKRFSKVLAKLRKFNPITYRDVYDVAKKEVIKHLLLKGVETLPKLVNSITTFLGS